MEQAHLKPLSRQTIRNTKVAFVVFLVALLISLLMNDLVLAGINFFSTLAVNPYINKNFRQLNRMEKVLVYTHIGLSIGLLVLFVVQFFI